MQSGNSATGRFALVTGGGSGIGEAVCHRLARDVDGVAVLDIHVDEARRVAEDIRQAGGNAFPVHGDVADRSSLDAAIVQVRAELGPVTVLVNNAAVESFHLFADIAEADWERIMQVNLKGPYLAVQAVLPDMIAAGWGRIVNISSLAAQIGAFKMAHYSASKGGVTSLTRTLAIELGAHGITVNAVAPSFIDTPMARRAIAANDLPIPFEEILKGYPIPRFGRPEEVAAACAFFASEEASYVTGQLLGVNGGAAF
ncbi:NAD(P)-dependent dehydrogenase (short-subunit alcohol dehydrogenase family) [Novosphingobium sp. PhB165]|uniref:SDR family NAD(P)-dependent oxidoreductase n=1 Tax=Novosphingobium sp. PhB165 TaxID=2485105 RepID=UPI001049FA58|nr:SDR family NAD(P)-dependent oxidoreductase [Novosphingobium sp. PhB165]TCM12730.1 NAD(P)-dependent dehydrogenase (short-subunit alcohol dehydrogenase family) [Novosphingobium sp. PhB165]